jgi:hypothetical protein
MTGTNERGTALVLAIVLTMVVGAVGAAVWTASRADSLMAANFSRAREALHVAEGGIGIALKDLAVTPTWNDVLTGTTVSSFTDGPAIGTKRLPSGAQAILCCGPGSLSDEVQQRARDGRNWAGDTPQWQLYAWGPASAWLPAGRIQSAAYVAVWISDDVVDGDGDPRADNNGIVEVHAQAFGVGGTRRIVEATVQRQVIGSSGLPGPGVHVLSWREVRW